ncbi:hypothetical protein H6G60_14695 [Coleofasciculus sp. FACHB-SPT36]|nr:hypothetical protein [Coleofasciculus sp. FACHB-SPT36]
MVKTTEWLLDSLPGTRDGLVEKVCPNLSWQSYDGFMARQDIDLRRVGKWDFCFL